MDLFAKDIADNDVIILSRTKHPAPSEFAGIAWLRRELVAELPPRPRIVDGLSVQDHAIDARQHIRSDGALADRVEEERLDGGSEA